MDKNTLIEIYGNLNQPDGTADRPLVTFALFAYNQEKYIREAVEGAFSQTYSPLEIILSDDYSIDRTFEIMQEMAIGYKGEHKILLKRNLQNMGIAAHFNQLINLSSSDLFVVAAGDDISMPERVSTLVDCWKLDKSLSFIDSGVIRIDENGHVLDQKDLVHVGKVTLLDYIDNAPVGLNGASRAYLRSSQKIFGELSIKCPTEDTPSLLRALMTGAGFLISRELVKYRVHSSNLSGAISLRSMNLEAIFLQYKVDVERAITLNILTEVGAGKVYKWVNKIRAIRLVNQQIDNGRLNIFLIVRLIINRNIFDFQMIIVLLIKYIKALFLSLKSMAKKND